MVKSSIYSQNGNGAGQQRSRPRTRSNAVTRSEMIDYPPPAACPPPNNRRLCLLEPVEFLLDTEPAEADESSVLPSPPSPYACLPLPSFAVPPPLSLEGEGETLPGVLLCRFAAARSSAAALSPRWRAAETLADRDWASRERTSVSSATSAFVSVASFRVEVLR